MLLVKKGYRLTKRGKYVAFSFICVLFLAIFSCVSMVVKSVGTEVSVKEPQKIQISVQPANNASTYSLPGCQLSLYFDPGDSALTVESKSALGFYAEIAKMFDKSTIQIEGNCASLHMNKISDEERKQNIELSLQRAEKVAEYLRTSGISKDRLIIKGNGSDKAINSNSTFFERKLNRRVDIIFLQDNPAEPKGEL